MEKIRNDINGELTPALGAAYNENSDPATGEVYSYLPDSDERELCTPFGGMRQSGVGRAGGWEALCIFTEPKNVCVKVSE